MGEGWEIFDRVVKLARTIVRAIRAGKTTIEEVEERLKDLFERPPRPVDLSEMEEALEERQRRSEEETVETPLPPRSDR